MGLGGFPTNLDLANILGRTDFIVLMLTRTSSVLSSQLPELNPSCVFAWIGIVITTLAHFIAIIYW